MLLLLLILSLAVCYVSMLRSGHAWGDDFAMYLLHAQNIADGIPYSETGYVVNPAEPYLGPATYPPVFPVFLAGVQRVFGSNITYFKIATIILFLLGLVIVFYLTADYLDWPWRLSLVAVFGLNPSIWGFRDQVLSDLPFLLFTYLSLLLIQKAYTASTPAVLNGVGVGAAIYLAIGTREAGAVLLPTLLAYDVYKTRRISVFAITAVAVAGLLAVIQTSIHQGSPGQAALLDPSPQWMVRNTIMYAKSLRTFWLNGFSSAFSYVFYACTLGLTIWGVFRTLRHRIGVIEIFVVLYFGLIVVFSVPGLYRYLLPIIPLYLLYGLVGLRHAAQRLQWGRAALLTLFVLAACTSYAGSYRATSLAPITEGIGDDEFVKLCEYVKDNTDKSDLVLFRKPRVLSLLSGRPAAVYFNTADRAKLVENMRLLRPAYVASGLIEHEDFVLDKTVLDPLLQADPRFKEIYRNSRYRLYRVETWD